MKTYLIRGVPASIQRDSWWMDTFEPYTPSRAPRQRYRLTVTALGLLLLTALAALGSEQGFSPTAPSHSLGSMSETSRGPEWPTS